MNSIAPTPADDPLDPRVWKIAAVVLLGPFMTGLDSTVVNVSISTIGAQLHAPLETAQWIVSGYLLALALMLPVNGWLVDRLGAKRLFVACFAGFTLASVLCGAARTMEQLILFRVVQGVAGGLLAPMTQLMLARVAGNHMARVMGLAATPVLIAPVVGPILAGAILKYASWPWLFFFNLPIGVVAVAMAVYLLPDDEDAARRRPFDLPGFLLISPGLALSLYGLEHVSHPSGAGTLSLGLVLLAAFVWRALRQGTDALLDLRLFQIRIFNAAASTQFLFSGALYAGQFLIPLFLISGCGVPPAQAGWLLAPMGLGMMISFPMMGLLTDKLGCRAVSAGGAVIALVGLFPFLWMARAGFSPALTAITLFVAGAGRGAIGIPSVAASYAAVPREKLPVATTTINIVQRLGGPIATTLTAIVVGLAISRERAASPASFAWPFASLIGLHALLLAAACRLPLRVPKRS